MRKCIVLFLALMFSVSIFFAQEKREISGALDKITKTSITVSGKAYPISTEVIVKEKDGTIIKNEEEKLDLKLFRAVERVKIVIIDEITKEIIIELRRE